MSFTVEQNQQNLRYHESCILQEGGPGVITTTQLFLYSAKKFPHQRYAKILLSVLPSTT